MATQGQKPVIANPLLARTAFENDLAVVLAGRGVEMEKSGWLRPNDLTLLIPVTGYVRDTAETPPFLLKLEFSHYPEWPPSAQFVNPITHTFTRPGDLYWLPRLEDEEIRTHSDYGEQHIQLICSSVTLEFYEVLHGVEAKYVWKHPRQNFAATLNQIEWALKNCYHGRFAPNPS